MKEKFLSWGTLLCLAVLTCLLLVHALAIFPGVPAIRWFFVTCAVVLGRLDVPAWVQAVGSVAAIGAAIAIASWQRSEERTASHVRNLAAARVVAVSVQPMLDVAAFTCQSMLETLSTVTEHDAATVAKFFHSVFARLNLPSEDQLLRLVLAFPEIAETIATGLSAQKRVGHVLDVLVTPYEGSQTEQLRNLLGSEFNLKTAHDNLKKAHGLLAQALCSLDAQAHPHRRAAAGPF
ncbi:hypothetical protein [Variovorax sp. PAMC26660]|uniref:hypothetical protein n=1 Tax=Variovorax sp. PAMC26660 TaxID=2762322 RepID=UPI0021C48299|nr:hypothetical protein [Variovorax sp. PAMC26660]